MQTDSHNESHSCRALNLCEYTGTLKDNSAQSINLIKCSFSSFILAHFRVRGRVSWSKDNKAWKGLMVTCPLYHSELIMCWWDEGTILFILFFFQIQENNFLVLHSSFLKIPSSFQTCSNSFSIFLSLICS